MPSIQQIQLQGVQGGANGELTGLGLSLRVLDCGLVRVELYRNAGDSAPVFVIDGLPLDHNDFASAILAVSETDALKCGTRLFITVLCAGAPFYEEDIEINCKDNDPPICPSGGPQLTIAPELPEAECIEAGNYTATVPGNWPGGTSFFWQIATTPGQFDVTGQTGLSYTHSASVGDGEVELLVTIIAPDCPPVSSSITLPTVASVTCPTSVTVEITGSDGVVRSIGFPSFNPPPNIEDLAPDTYLIGVASPSSTELIWIVDGEEHSTDATISMTIQPNTSKHIQISVRTPCCTTLWPSFFLETGDGSAPVVPPDDDDPTSPVRDPIEDPPQPPFWCPWLCRFVTIALVVFLVGLVTAVATTPLGAALYPALAAVLPAIASATLLLMICNRTLCGLLQRVVWSLKWTVVLGALVALMSLSGAALIFVVSLGVLTGILLVWMSAIPCADPPMTSLVC